MTEKRKPLGETLSPILAEIELALLEMEIAIAEKPCFTNEGFRAATKIFMACILDKMWELQENEDISLKDRSKMAEKAGKDLRKFVKIFTNIDTFDLFKQ